VLEQSVAEQPEDLRDFAEKVILGFWEFIEATPDLQLAQYELTVHAMRDPELMGLAQFQYARMARAVMLVLDHVPDAPDGDLREDLARYLAATMDGLILHHVVQQDTHAARRRIALYLATMDALGGRWAWVPTRSRVANTLVTRSGRHLALRPGRSCVSSQLAASRRGGARSPAGGS
jgi:hypothetical protein